MLGREGLPCATAVPRLFADASEVPPNNKAATTAIKAALVMFFLQALRTWTYGLCGLLSSGTTPAPMLLA
jgi:hypothetical protein